MVARRDDAAGVKALVEAQGGDEALTREHLQSFRPWGNYPLARHGPAPSGQAHRGEAGRPAVAAEAPPPLRALDRGARHRRGHGRRKVKTLHENESIYIPIGAVHRLENPGKIDLEIIEVQTGSYLGEDDIIRIEDVYNRAAS